jgi:hypothetical protein
MLAPLNPARDLKLSGQVIYTGRSSMQVAVKMETIGMDHPEETVLLGMMLYLKVYPGDIECIRRPVFYGVQGRRHALCSTSQSIGDINCGRAHSSRYG